MIFSFNMLHEILLANDRNYKRQIEEKQIEREREKTNEN